MNSTGVFPVNAVTDSFHHPETCLIAGNGPSLADVRNDVLSQFVTFGANRCYLKFEPTYYFLVDELLCKSNVIWNDEVNSLPSQKFIISEYADKIEGSTPLNCIHRMGFSFEPLEHLYTYFSVVTAMLQIAYWMGFKRIGLVGLDHRFNEPRGTREWHPINEDTNHFTKDYYTDYMTQWKAPRLDKLTEWLERAKSIFEKDGIEVINLTPGSALQTFPFGDLKDWQ